MDKMGDDAAHLPRHSGLDPESTGQGSRMDEDRHSPLKRESTGRGTCMDAYRHSGLDPEAALPQLMGRVLASTETVILDLIQNLTAEAGNLHGRGSSFWT